MGLILLGMLRMPMPDYPGQCDIVTWCQAVGAMQLAADKIEAQNTEIERLQAEISFLTAQLDAAKEMFPPRPGMLLERLEELRAQREDG